MTSLFHVFFLASFGFRSIIGLSFEFLTLTFSSLPTNLRRIGWNLINLDDPSPTTLQNLIRFLNTSTSLREEFYDSLVVSESKAKTLVRYYLGNQQSQDLMLPTRFVEKNRELQISLIPRLKSYRPSIIDFTLEIHNGEFSSTEIAWLLSKGLNSPSKWGSMETILMARQIFKGEGVKFRTFHKYYSWESATNSELRIIDQFYHHGLLHHAFGISRDWVEFHLSLERGNSMAKRAILSIMRHEDDFYHHFKCLAQLIRENFGQQPEIAAIWEIKLIIAVFRVTWSIPHGAFCQFNEKEHFKKITSSYFDRYQVNQIAPAYLGMLVDAITHSRIHINLNSNLAQLNFRLLDRQFPFSPAFYGSRETYISKWSIYLTSSFAGWKYPISRVINNAKDLIDCLPTRKAMFTAIPSGPQLLQTITFSSGKTCKEINCFLDEALYLIYTNPLNERPRLIHRTFVPGVTKLEGFWEAYSILLMTFLKFKNYIPLSHWAVYELFQDGASRKYPKSIIAKCFLSAGLIKFLPVEMLVPPDYRSMIKLNSSIRLIIPFIIVLSALATLILLPKR